jgi:hypothetical protein
MWVVELLWVADSVLHHVDSVSGLANTLPMEDQHGKEQAQVDGQVVLESKVKSIHGQDASNEGHLDYEKENCSIENIHLIVNLKLEFLLVSSHKSKVADGVHVS